MLVKCCRCCGDGETRLATSKHQGVARRITHHELLLHKNAAQQNLLGQCAGRSRMPLRACMRPRVLTGLGARLQE